MFRSMFVHFQFQCCQQKHSETNYRLHVTKKKWLISLLKTLQILYWVTQHQSKCIIAVFQMEQLELSTHLSVWYFSLLRLISLYTLNSPPSRSIKKQPRAKPSISKSVGVKHQASKIKFQTLSLSWELCKIFFPLALLTSKISKASADIYIYHSQTLCWESIRDSYYIIQLG